ncbi:hypothetical protein MKX01_036281 [Papaver californicum]|nr:hypothetical protein MKX01_036281 [Papaver californicum]
MFSCASLWTKDSCWFLQLFGKIYAGLIFHKTKLCAAALAPFKADASDLPLFSHVKGTSVWWVGGGGGGGQNNPKHNMRCSTC